MAANGANKIQIASCSSVLFLQSDRKSTRLNSSHSQISYAVFCLKKQDPVLDAFTHDFNTIRICLAAPHLIESSPPRYHTLDPVFRGATAAHTSARVVAPVLVHLY